MVLDLGKLVSVETVYADVVAYVQKRKRADTFLKWKYTDLWLEGGKKYEEAMQDEFILPDPLIMELAQGASAVFAELIAQFPHKEVLEKANASQPDYYGMLLNQNPIPDLSRFYSIADSVVREIDSLYHGNLQERIATQFKNDELKKHFLDALDEKFKERGYCVLGIEQANEQVAMQYLFILAEDKIQDILQQQRPGRERFVRYIKKEMDFSAVDPTDIELEIEEIGNKRKEEEKR